MDRQPVEGPGPHIVGDVTTYPFQGRAVIRAVYVERLDTCILRDGEVTASALRRDNLLCQAVQNVASAMAPGAVMEIEWHPFSRFLGVAFSLEQIQGFIAQ